MASEREVARKALIERICRAARAACPAHCRPAMATYPEQVERAIGAGLEALIAAERAELKRRVAELERGIAELEANRVFTLRQYSGMVGCYKSVRAETIADCQRALLGMADEYVEVKFDYRDELVDASDRLPAAVEALAKEPNPRSVSWEGRGEVRMRKSRFFVHHSDDASDAPLSGIALGTTGTLRCTFEPDEEA